MNLRSDANELLKILQTAVGALKRFDHPNGVHYADEMATRLAPLVSDLERAVVVDRSRADAAGILDSISSLMHDVNGAATRGDLEIFPDHNDQTLNRYWHLNTIFRESKYYEQEL